MKDMPVLTTSYSHKLSSTIEESRLEDLQSWELRLISVEDYFLCCNFSSMRNSSIMIGLVQKATWAN